MLLRNNSELMVANDYHDVTIVLRWELLCTRGGGGSKIFEWLITKHEKIIDYLIFRLTITLSIEIGSETVIKLIDKQKQREVKNLSIYQFV